MGSPFVSHTTSQAEVRRPPLSHISLVPAVTYNPPVFAVFLKDYHLLTLQLSAYLIHFLSVRELAILLYWTLLPLRDPVSLMTGSFRSTLLYFF